MSATEGWSAPAWLTEALRAHPFPAPNPDVEDDPRVLFPGDICIADQVDGDDFDSALVMVLEAEEGSHSVQGVLLTPDVELASDSDPILRADETDLGYDVAVLTWASGPLYVDQFRKRVGGIDDETLAAVVGAQWRQDTVGTLTVGDPLLDRALDPRWAELDQLSATFASLIQPCLDFLDVLAEEGGGDTIPVVDPALYVQDAQERLAGQDPAAYARLMRGLARGSWTMSGTAVAILARSHVDLFEDPALSWMAMSEASVFVEVPLSPLGPVDVDGVPSASPTDEARLAAAQEISADGPPVASFVSHASVAPAGRRRVRIRSATSMRIAELVEV